MVVSDVFNHLKISSESRIRLDTCLLEEWHIYYVIITGDFIMGRIHVPPDTWWHLCRTIFSIGDGMTQNDDILRQRQPEDYKELHSITTGNTSTAQASWGITFSPTVYHLSD